jgi:hypothetical protein
VALFWSVIATRFSCRPSSAAEGQGKGKVQEHGGQFCRWGQRQLQRSAFGNEANDFAPREFIGMPTTRRKTSRRTLIEPHKGDRRYVRRNKKGQFKTQVNVGRSLAADRRRKSKTKAAKGQGDRGDM